MQHKLDYSAVWRDARVLLTAHSEAIVAVAGFFIFMAAWVTAYILPPLVFADLNDMAGSIQQISGYFENNWYILLPNMLVTMFGSFILYILLAGRGIVTVGDALSTALVLFLPYLSASIIVGWASFAGFLLFLVPGLYLTGRLALLPAVLAHEPELGAMGAIRQAWHTSKGHAWSILVVLMFVALGVRVLSGIVMAIVAAIAIAVAGEGGVPVINAVVTAIFAAIEAVAYVLLTVAIHRQLASRE